MRITNSMMVKNMMRYMGNNLQRMDKIQQNLATGKKFLKPSDDPIGVSRSLRLNTDVSVMNQFKRNVDDAQSWLSTTEVASNNIIDILQRSRELTLQASNGTNTVQERQKISDEITQLRDQLVSIGNSTYAGSYIFSGFKTDQPLLNKDGTYALGGNFLSVDENIKYGIGIGENLDINFIGQKIFGFSDSGEANLDLSVADSMKANQILNGSFISFDTPMTLDNTNNQFDINFQGAAYTINLTQPATYDGVTAGQQLSDLKTDIENQINADPALNGKITVYQEGSRLYFKSYDSTSADNTISLTSGTFDVSQIGFVSNKKSTSVVDSGNKTNLIGALDQLILDLNSDNQDGINKALDRLSMHIDNVNAVRAELGVKSNRLELTSNRIDDDVVNLTTLLSKNEDVDMAEVIMNLKMQENVYNASLAGGAKIIQPSLVDFLR